jgi:hypothetical protein
MMSFDELNEKQFTKNNRDIKHKNKSREIDEDKIISKQKKRAFKLKMRQIEEDDDSWKEWDK